MIFDFPDKIEPTVYKDGLARMLRIWEASRDHNAGGYGGSTLFSVWGNDVKTITSCTPFTATCIGMMFDSGSNEDPSTRYRPKYHGGQKDLPRDFYSLHNGNYFRGNKLAAARTKAWRAKGWPTSRNEQEQLRISISFFNLGYQISPRDMRRGDLVSILWKGNGGGHAAFCWDVHLDSSGAVDAFLFVSANSCGPHTGPGVTVGAVDYSPFLTGSAGSYAKRRKLFADDPKNTQYGMWLCVPKTTKDRIDLTTFHKNEGPFYKQRNFRDLNDTWGAKELTVMRFWGFAPPESPHGDELTRENQDLAEKLARETLPDSWATGSGKPPEGRIPNVSTTPVPKSHPDPVSVPSPKPAQQAKDQVVPHQHFVEGALTQLHDAGWIDKSPGETDSTHDAQTRAAVKDFQSKFKSGPVDGIPGPITKAALKQALADLHAGKPNPNKDRKTKLDRAYWVGNRVDPGGKARLAVEGENLDLVETFELVLEEIASGKKQSMSLPAAADARRGTLDVAIPELFAIGSAIAVRLTAVASGARHENAPKHHLHVGALDTPPGDWPWDEKLWTPQMRDIIADLRGTPAPTGPFDRFEITQFGVKEKLEAGDVEVKSKKGQVFGTVSLRSLMLADIEGTMRLDGRILNITQTGNVYEPKEVMVDGKKVIKKKPVAAKFDPSKSLWVDVTAQNPWGAGARMPLIPFRTLAINPSMNRSMYNQKVYIKQLDGQTMPGTNERHNGICIVGDAGGMRKTHFDLFVGREDHHIRVPSVGTGDATICEIQLLGDCPASHKRGR